METACHGQLTATSRPSSIRSSGRSDVWFDLIAAGLPIRAARPLLPVGQVRMKGGCAIDTVRWLRIASLGWSIDSPRHAKLPHDRFLKFKD